MKLGVSSYSFNNLVTSGAMTQLDVISKAKEMGFDAIEFSTLTLPEGETALSFAPRVKEECERVGLEVVNYTIWADFLNSSKGDWQSEVERLKGEVEVAKILGSPGIRHDATWGFPDDYIGAKGFDDALPTLIKGCRGVTEYAADQGIKTMVENHGYFAQDSQRIEKIVNGVDHPNFGVLIDMGNFLCADEDPTKAIGRLLPYVSHVHAKDFHVKCGNGPNPGQGWFHSRGGKFLRGAIIGHGDLPMLQCIRLVRESGYKGVMSIEFEGIEEPLKGIAISCENLKSYVSMC